MADGVEPRLARQRPNQHINQEIARALMGPIERLPSEVAQDPGMAILLGLFGAKTPRGGAGRRIEPSFGPEARYQREMLERWRDREANPEGPPMQRKPIPRRATDEVAPAPPAASPGEASSAPAQGSMRASVHRPQGEAVPGTFVDYDPATHGPASRALLDDMLTQAERTRSPNLSPEFAQRLAESAQARHALQGLPQAHPSELLRRAQGTTEELMHAQDLARAGGRGSVTAPALRDQVLNMATGRGHTLGLSGMAGGAAVAAAMGLPDQAEASEEHQRMIASELMRMYYGGR